MRIAARALALALAIATTAGCCSIFPAHRIPQDDYYSSLTGFLHAIATEQWDNAYSRLTEKSREGFSPITMEFLFEWGEVPQTTVKFSDLLRDYDQYYRQSWREIDADTGWFPLLYERRSDEGTDEVYMLRVFLARRTEIRFGVEMDVWEIDLLRTAHGG